MVYNAVAQVEQDALSNGSNASPSPPPPPHRYSFHPLSMDFDNLGGSNHMDTAKTADETGSTRLGSLMRSLGSTGTSYDMVEDDDYEITEKVPDTNHTPNLPRNGEPGGSGRRQHSSSPEPIVRTTSTGRPIPLRHPTPDLQSLQGAYVGNVERLEQSAERLSMTSDIGEELRKMKMEQRRSEAAALPASDLSQPAPTRQFSSGSISNSIIGLNNGARSGGYSPAGYISSPKGSFRSGSWSQSNRPRSASRTSRLASLPEPEQEGRPLDSPIVSHSSFAHPSNLATYQHPFSPDELQNNEYDHHGEADYNPDERPPTAASADTHRQATSLFVDFDGVHYSPRTLESLSRQASLTRSRVPSGQEPPPPHPNDGMVYYPAPVPVMLNLPQKLSKMPSAAERERRRTQLLSTVPPDARKSAPWLSGVPEVDESDRQGGKRSAHQSTGNLSSIPAHLRASAFFDQPAARQEIEVKQSSAVATLDSILDASAHAPVSAFTDHPIVGHVGSEVYGKSRPRKSDPNRKSHSSVNLLRSRENARSSHTLRSRGDEEAVDEAEVEAANGSGEDVPFRHSRDIDPGDALMQPEDEGQEESEEEEEEQEEEAQYSGPPTTLLAELQLRKQQQKQRNRTAATAFPNGMHSTLLELDAVAQVQEQSRKHKHITLAWEDPEVFPPQDDDDVPLGMLFPSKKHRDDNRPLGLMEKREMEDNEPLSRRRARLRGDVPAPQNPSPAKRASTMYTLEVPGLTDKNGDDEGETLAQRVRRLKAQGGTATGLGNDFTSEVLSQLGGDTGKSKTPDAEETLGQRRKRLQEEARSREVSGGSNPEPLTARRSMADILQAHPAAGARKPSNEHVSSYEPWAAAQPPQFGHLGQYGQNAFAQQSFQTPGSMMYGGASGYPYANGLGYGQMIYPQMGMNGYVDPMMIQADMSLDPKQRDMIDRWRQSVLQ